MEMLEALRLNLGESKAKLFTALSFGSTVCIMYILKLKSGSVCFLMKSCNALSYELVSTVRFFLLMVVVL